MGQAQIEKRKKKGRPSKADLAARRAAVQSTAPPPSDDLHRRDLRRSSRRRSFRYSIIDYDEDYLNDDAFDEDDDDVEEREHEDEDEEEDDDDDEDERSGDKKKLKLVLKLNNKSSRRNRASRVGSVSRPGRVAVNESESSEDEDEEDEDEEEKREVKKRRINGGGEDFDEIDNCDNDEDEGVDVEKESKRGDSVPGTPTDNNTHSDTPLPDKKQLELILDKLQKKDTYGVYAEPVDPEELPDYFDIVEHPMDFSTVRKKLANGSYSILEQFEADVFLISSNAMQYNAPETIYHKQARAIKELAEKKFQRMRLQIERLEKEPKSEPKSEPKCEQKSELRDRPNSLLKKQSKKPFSRNLQEPLGSEFSSGATLATADANNNCGIDAVGNLERLGNNDGLAEGISFLVDNSTDKAEDPHSGRGVLPKFGRRSFLVDENRRATYNISSQNMEGSESIFTPFDNEKKQLIPVGSPGEHSYARSLARFAANLGPIAWRVASKRLEQVLPPGFKFGRGWIGEYEPLPTVVVFEGRKEYPFVSRSHDVAESGKNDKKLEGTVPGHVEPLNQPTSDGKLPSIFGSRGVRPPTSTVSVPQQQKPPSPVSGGPENMMVKRVEFNCLSASDQKNIAVFQPQNRPLRTSVCPENMGAKRVEPNSPSSYNQKTDHVTQRQLPYGVEMGVNRTRPNSPSICNQKLDHVVQKQCPTSMEAPTAKAIESVPKSKFFLQSLPFKQPDANGSTYHEGLQNARSINNFADSNRVIPSSPGLIPTHLTGPMTSFPQRHDQGVNDPVLVMKMLTEKAQKQQNGSLQVHAQSPSQARPSVPSPRGDGGSHAAAAAASAWMSAGAVGFRPAAQNPTSTRSLNSADPYGTRMLYPQAVQARAEYPVSATMHFQPEKKGFPFQAFVPQPVNIGNEPQVSSRPMVFPQMVTNDLSRFPAQSPWRGLSPHTQQKQKQETLPPDLNVAFQSVDSQQPDLALQL